MSALAVTAANVVASAAAVKEDQIAGVSITAGQSIAISTANGQAILYSANTATNGANIFRGIALNNAAAGQPVKLCRADPNFTPGATLTTGETIIGHATAGGIGADSEAATGYFKTILGPAISPTEMILAPVASGVAM